jgi:threonine-phosphate decarboxylase
MILCDAHQPEKERIQMGARLPERVMHGGMVKRYEQLVRKRLIEFSASLNPFPPPVTWEVDPDTLTQYPDDSYSALKEVIGSTFDRSPDEICVGNGSIELIRVFCTAALQKGDRVRIPCPTFGEYAYSCQLAGATVTDHGPAKASFICNPNNPTGILRTREDLIAELAEAERSNTLIFLDEAFIELSDIRQSLVDQRSPHLFLIRSLTKAFAVPGLRIGYGFGDPDLIRKIEAMRLPWTVNAHAEAFAMQAFENYHSLSESRHAIECERSRLMDGLRSLGLSYAPSATNFILIHLPLPAERAHALLLSHGILVRDCTSFGLPESIRAAVRTQEENQQLLEALSQCLP